MAQIGNYILYIIMACSVIGAIAAIRNDESELAQEFMEGLNSIGPIFMAVGGIMAAAPYLSIFVETVFGPVFGAIGADPSIAATTFIAVDMGGYQLAEALASTKESWIMAMTTGYMAGATIVFSIPVGLAMLQKKDHKYMALGVMSGILTIPVGVFVTTIILALTNASVRGVISTDAEATYQLAFTFGQIMINLVPLIIFCALLAIGLRIFPDKMIKGFMVFGKFMDTGIKLVLVFSIVEYFTGFFSTVLGGWGFDPIIADSVDQFRALEIAGYIGIMLTGAFPMVYLIKKYLAKPLQALGQRFGFTALGSAGILAGAANILALFRIIQDMEAADKVKCIAFSVCAAFLLGDHLAFTANFQPTMIIPVMAGKLSAGLLAIAIATKLSVPKARELEALEKLAA
ncbi:MAG: ethanolamine utilization protein EutH [Clostridiales bacterium]|nr:ethanolamine utilization protein EutH [Clostridiales bacterium]